MRGRTEYEAGNSLQNPPVVLVADDECFIRDLTRDALENAGFVVLTAGGGEQALGLSRDFPGTIDVLVSDVNMPGLGGIALREQILQERPGIKVLLMSGLEPVEGLPFLAKPFNGETLAARVRELLSSARPAR